MTRKIGSFLLMAVALTIGAGCIGSKGSWMHPYRCMETLAETGEEHENRVERVLEQDRRALAEDMDLLFQTERPTRLTRWHSR